MNFKNLKQNTIQYLIIKKKIHKKKTPLSEFCKVESSNEQV